MNYLEITGSETAAQVSEVFNGKYEYLKLHFFSKSHAVNAPSARKEMLSADMLTGTMIGFIKPGKISMDPTVTVSNLEQEFHDLIGLNVQVFRKSGSLWLETSATDYMTLKEQNELGREKSFPVGQQDDSDFDYE